MIPLQTLVIHSGKAVWTLYVDATCINYDGNLSDATLIAMVSALLNGEPQSHTLFLTSQKILMWLGIFSQATKGDVRRGIRTNDMPSRTQNPFDN